MKAKIQCPVCKKWTSCLVDHHGALACKRCAKAKSWSPVLIAVIIVLAVLGIVEAFRW